MRNRFSYAAGLLGLGLIVGSAAGAGEKVLEKHVIAVRAGDGETVEADVSDLMPGEARSFVTGDGTAIDVLRGADGIEIYIDGELVETPAGAEAGLATLHRELEIECEADEKADCDEQMLFLFAGAAALDGDAGAGATRIRIVCDGDGGCDEEVWIGEDGEAAALEDLPEGEQVHVIRIREEIEQREVEEGGAR